VNGNIELRGTHYSLTSFEALSTPSDSISTSCALLIMNLPDSLGPNAFSMLVVGIESYGMDWCNQQPDSLCWMLIGTHAKVNVNGELEISMW